MVQLSIRLLTGRFQLRILIAEPAAHLVAAILSATNRAIDAIIAML
jgi:hypothetical protein